MTEQELMRRHVEGDRSAFPELREQYRSQLIRYFALRHVDEATDDGMVQTLPDQQAVSLRTVCESMADKTLDRAARYYEMFSRGQSVNAGIFAIAEQVNGDAMVIALDSRSKEKDARNARILERLGI